MNPKPQKKPHRAWLILAACILFQGATTGIMFNCLGLFYASICKDLGFSMGSMSLYNTIRQLATAATLPYMILLLKKRKMHRTLLVMTLICTLCFGMMGIFHHLYEFYISGAVVGVAGSIVFAVPVTIVINNWFQKKKSLAMGIAFSASGVAGTLMNPICSWIILQTGWRTAAWIMAGLSLLLTVPSILFVIRRNPEEAGCSPYGAEEFARLAAERTSSAQTSTTSGAKLQAASTDSIQPSRQSHPVLLLVCCMIITAVAYWVSQYNSHLVTFGQSTGMTLMAASTVASFAMTGNVLSKILLGMVAEKWGYKLSLYAGLFFSALGFAIFLLFGQFEIGLYIGGLFFGTTMALATVVPSLIAAHLYENDGYEEHYSKMMTAGYVASAVGFSAIGFSYDFFGSYFPSIGFSLVLCLLAGIAGYLIVREDKASSAV